MTNIYRRVTIIQGYKYKIHWSKLKDDVCAYNAVTTDQLDEPDKTKGDERLLLDELLNSAKKKT